MLTGRLNNAAILLHLSLKDNGINYAVIGGYAITHFGGNRQAKDIDCITNASKQQIINALDPEAGLVIVSQDRNDYVDISWSDMPDRSNAVPIHIFCSVYPGARCPNVLFQFETHEVKGDELGNGVRYTTEIKVRRHKIHLVDIGRALKQHPNLEGCFDPLEIDFAKAKIAAKDFIPAGIPSRGVEGPPKDLFDRLADSRASEIASIGLD